MKTLLRPPILFLGIGALLAGAAGWGTFVWLSGRDAGHADSTRRAIPAMDPDAPCGVIALTVFARLLGTELSLERAAAVLRRDLDGTCSLADLSDALATIGISCMALEIAQGALGRWHERPVIFHVARGHFVAGQLLPGGRAVILDAPQSPKTLGAEEIAARFGRRVVVLMQADLALAPSGGWAAWLNGKVGRAAGSAAALGLVAIFAVARRRLHGSAKP